MNYYSPVVTCDNLTLSCDMVRIVFQFDDYVCKQFNNFVNDLFLEDKKYDFKMYQSYAFFSYRYILNFRYSDSSFIVGLSFNGCKKNDSKGCFIEFNPNKCLSNCYVTPILDFIKNYGRSIEIVRYDFAIDIKCKRLFCCLTKDLRDYSKVYKVEQTSIDSVTEYLGHRNKNGFVKLYNKSKESNLDYDLTRLEITLDCFDYDNFKKQLPIVYFVKNVNLFDSVNLNDTDKVLLSLLLQNANFNIYLKMLGRGKQDKLKKILFDLNSTIDISEYDYWSVIRNIRQIIA